MGIGISNFAGVNADEKHTEKASHYDDLEKMEIFQILEAMNREDAKVPLAIAKVLPRIELVVEQIVSRLEQGGRLFYIGAGTSGRLGIVDASECPPTFGVDQGIVIGIIAGGDSAIRKAVEFAEDDVNQAWKDLERHGISGKDFLVGIAASGTTPYVSGGLSTARAHGIGTACITCNSNSPVAASCDYPIEVIVGPEVVTGSTRLKAGTAQKLVLNMISTATMIRLGKVKGSRMVDMQLSNTKLVERGTRMIMEELGLAETSARELLLKHGSVRKAIESQR